MNELNAPCRRAGSPGTATREGRRSKARPSFALAALIAACIALAPGLAFADGIGPDYSWYVDGKGAVESPYELENAADFLGFIELVNGTADTDGDSSTDPVQDSFAGRKIVLANEINFQGQEIAPAGGAQFNTSFEGTLDGQGNAVTGFVLSYGREASKVTVPQNMGLIGHAGKNSLITRVKVGAGAALEVDFSADGTTAALSSDEVVKNVGLLVGKSEGNVTYCENRGSVTVYFNKRTGGTMASNVAGMAGMVWGDVTGCANSGAVEVGRSSSAGYSGTHIHIAGVVGCAGEEHQGLDPASGKTHGSVTNCVNSGTVSTTKIQFGYNMGGVVGYSRGDVVSCVNSGLVWTSSGSVDTAGGVVGNLRSAWAYYDGPEETITEADGAVYARDCVNLGDVYVEVGAGGVVGVAGPSSVVIGCVNGSSDMLTGARAGNYVFASSISSKVVTGGVVSQADGAVCFNANYGVVGAATWTNYADRVYKTNDRKNLGGIVGRAFEESSMFSNINLGALVGYYYRDWGTWEEIRGHNICGSVDHAAQAYGNVALTGLVVSDSMCDQDGSTPSVPNVAVSLSRLKANGVLTAEEYPAGGGEASILGMMNSKTLEGDGCSWSVSAGVNGGYPTVKAPTDVLKADLADLDVKEVVQVKPAPYTGAAGSAPVMRVVLSDGASLEQYVDFMVIPQADAVAQGGPYKAELVGMGAYKGSLTGEYSIGKLNLADCTVEVASPTFNWVDQTPIASEVRVLNPAGGEVDANLYELTVNGEAAPESAADGGNGCVDAGSYEVVATAVEGSDAVEGSVTGSFVIAPASLKWDESQEDGGAGNAHPTAIETAEGTLDGAWQSYYTVRDKTGENVVEDGTELAVYPYTGRVIYPQVSVGWLGKEVEVVREGCAPSGDAKSVIGLYPGIPDFGVGVEPPDNIGKAGEKAIGGVVLSPLSAEGNFTGFDGMVFCIDGNLKPNLANATFALEYERVTYEEGAAYEPKVTMGYLGSKYFEGVDFEVTYEGNDAPGVATVTVTPGSNGIWEGSATLEFEIADPSAALGDADGNGVVDYADATLVLRCYAGLEGGGAVDPAAADVDGSGVVDFDDATLILRFYVGLIDRFPASA